MSTAPADPMVPRIYSVQRTEEEIPETVSMELRPVAGELPSFVAGQFNMIYVFGVGEIPLSISSDPAQSEFLIHTTRAVGVVSRAVCELQKGDLVGVRGPFGTGWPLELAEGHDVALLAGGIGLAPLRAAIYHLIAHRQRYGKVELLYGARTPDILLFQSEIAAWQHAGIDVAITVDQATASWNGRVGVVTRLLPQTTYDPKSVIAMVCGPEIMMRFAALGLEQQGVAPDHIFVSMERNMQCAIGFCGHCQYSSFFICKDGPVFPYQRVQQLLEEREI
ncbi:MAG: FAD/NAD(P)-binding protein [Ktedonobacterales bacterium]